MEYKKNCKIRLFWQTSSIIIWVMLIFATFLIIFRKCCGLKLVEYIKFRKHDSGYSFIIVIRHIYKRFASDASLFYKCVGPRCMIILRHRYSYSQKRWNLPITKKFGCVGGETWLLFSFQKLRNRQKSGETCQVTWEIRRALWVDRQAWLK